MKTFDKGGKRADGAAQGRQMQATPGHWWSLQDSRKRILTSGDSRYPGATHTVAAGFDSTQLHNALNAHLPGLLWG
jgi:hypothetical protein